MDRRRAPDSRRPLSPIISRDRMSPPSGDAPNTPESKSSSGIAGVFKSTFGGRLHRNPAPINAAASSLSPSSHGTLTRSRSRGTLVGLGDGEPELFLGRQPDYIQQYGQQLQPGKPLQGRVEAAQALRMNLEPLTSNNIVDIWSASKDLLDPRHSQDVRSAGFELLTACVNHSSHKPLQRRAFYETLSAPLNPDDFHLQLSAMRDLTSDGRSIHPFEASILPLLTQWLKSWFIASVAARTAQKDKLFRTNGTLGEETNLTQLYNFIINVVKYNYKIFAESDVRALLEEVLVVCRRTTSEQDIRNSIQLIDAIITYGSLPQEILSPCIEVLCGIYNQLKPLADITWNAIANLCRSHVAQLTLNALFNVLRKSNSAERNTNTIRGALSIIQKLIMANGVDNLVLVPLQVALESFRKALAADSARLELDIVTTIDNLLGEGEIVDALLEEDCSNLLNVLRHASGRADTLLDNSDLMNQKDTKEIRIGNMMTDSLNSIFGKIETLFHRFEIIEKEKIIDFFFSVHDRLSDSCAELLILYYIEEHLCYPSNTNWLVNSNRLIDAFFRTRNRHTPVRLLVLRAMRDVYETIKDVYDAAAVDELIWAVLDDIQHERDIQVLQVLVNFAVEVGDDADQALFARIVESLQATLRLPDTPSTNSSSSVRNESRPSSSATISNYTNSLDNVVARGFVHIFMRAFNESAEKASKAFEIILEIARSETCAVDARLSAMKLLFRLRSDSSHSMIIVSTLDSDGLASALNRTTQVLHLRDVPEEVPPSRHSMADDASSVRSNRSTSAGHPHSYMSRSNTRSMAGKNKYLPSSIPLWKYPDENALPQDPPSTPSHLLHSFDDRPVEITEKLREEEPRTVLAMNIWLEVLISIIQQGGDWEIYSHVLVHLGSQLTNHSLFEGAKPQIQLLRSVICEQIKGNSFHEPPPSSGLKKADVTICLFHTLTMVLSYSRHFSKNEEDEIVRTFMHGVGSWERTAKRCIHALTICCHEVPLSISKSMNTILQKMSQIITQAHVAVHVLEFLAGLARMPEIYVNFREDDFRTVFGICFRYLQYVRDQRAKGSGPTSTRTSYASGRQGGTTKDYNGPTDHKPSPVTADELPQYVYALAYHVMTFWFMSLKVVDRAKHVGWITKNLISTDINGRESMDEQSQVTIDMMQRVAYSDLDETMHDPYFASVSDGEVMKKSWLDGLSIVTVETAAATGLSQITKRQPSGTSHSIFKLERAPMPHHQIISTTDTKHEGKDASSRVAVLPSHIFLQISATSYGLPEALRPIPLPDDDMTARAIGTFDRNSTVDGHKVGVIYIGENQSTEQEILANVMGSHDYTDLLGRLGTLTRLKGARFNTQGLDREHDTDGQFTYCWRDRVTEIVYHITTMMPTNLEHDPQCINKKRHTGNDFVNIIFNNSGQPFRFDTFPSDFNYVNIVITPESRASFVATRTHIEGQETDDLFYKVQVMSKPGFPEISPASETKIISGKSLPAFVRLIALNASVFSLVWATRDGGEHISSWRNRLREIVKLREKHAPSSASHYNTPSHALTASTSTGNHSLLSSRDSGIQVQRESLNRRASTATFLTDSLSSHRSSVVSTATETDTGTAATDCDGVLESFDFSRWA